MKIIVAQIGAREHYAVAQALHQRGRLAALVTDWYAFGGKSRKQKVENRNIFQRSAFDRFISAFSVLVFQRLGKRGGAALAAHCAELPDELVHAFPFRSLFWTWRARRAARAGRSHAGYVQTDSAFASAVARMHLPAHDVFFGYSYASLEMLAAEKQRGVLTVLDQIDPGPVEFRLVAEEMARHPELAGAPAEFPAAYYERNRREWELADIIIVNSEWSREALIAEGANPAKIEILPLAYEVNEEKLKSEMLKAEIKSQKPRVGDRQNEEKQKVESRIIDTPHPSPLPMASQRGEGENFQLSTLPVSTVPPLRVLWLGQVNVRKGIHYLIEAARLLKGENVRFDVVGPSGISVAAINLAPDNVRFHGSVSRDRAAEWYRQSDVFVLPTLSDGFALTQLEALAYGLPVIATPHCGRVVAEGKTGFIIPARDPQALADAILKFAADRNLSPSMAPACREAVKTFSVEAYGRRLVEIINEHRKK